VKAVKTKEKETDTAELPEDENDIVNEEKEEVIIRPKLTASDRNWIQSIHSKTTKPPPTTTTAKTTTTSGCPKKMRHLFSLISPSVLILQFYALNGHMIGFPPIRFAYIGTGLSDYFLTD
jgi:hypothetical protein